MFHDYHTVYEGDIFAQSRCIWHENVLLDWFSSQLSAMGYDSPDHSNKIWNRDKHTVICCLVDDITTCSKQSNPKVPKLWPREVTVITDNFVTCPTLYSVHTLPVSWFGIYAHRPNVIEWQPDRRFNFSVNRLDIRRMLLFFEYRKRLPWEPNRDTMDYVNFNCWDWNGDNDSDEGLIANFDRQWNLLDPEQRTMYQLTLDTDTPAMPYRNHDLAHDQALHRAWLNLVVETYSGDSVIALSEKTFRALVTPAPWMIYAGRHAVTYLESLGFDCLDDVIDHGYDHMIETRTVDYGDKIVDWFWIAQDNYDRLISQDLSKLQTRCQAAANHNRNLLHDYRARWPKDFATWWNDIVEVIA